MKLILNSLLFIAAILGTACDDHQPYYDAASEHEKRSDAEAIEKFIGAFEKTKPGDFVHFRNVYWQIESVDESTQVRVMAGRNAKTAPAEPYRPNFIKLTDKMRFTVHPSEFRGARGDVASMCYTITSADENYSSVLCQWIPDSE